MGYDRRKNQGRGKSSGYRSSGSVAPSASDVKNPNKHYVPLVQPAMTTHYPDHSGRRIDSKPKLWGEVHITFTTQTPFLPGNDQLEWGELCKKDESFQAWAKKNLEDRGVKSEKKVIMPLRLVHLPNAPVVVTGAALKGMLTQRLGAMFGSPITRVNDTFDVSTTRKETLRAYKEPSSVDISTMFRSPYQSGRIVQMQVVRDPVSHRLRVSNPGVPSRNMLSDDSWSKSPRDRWRKRFFKELEAAIQTWTEPRRPAMGVGKEGLEVPDVLLARYAEVVEGWDHAQAVRRKRRIGDADRGSDKVESEHRGLEAYIRDVRTHLESPSSPLWVEFEDNGDGTSRVVAFGPDLFVLSLWKSMQKIRTSWDGERGEEVQRSGFHAHPEEQKPIPPELTMIHALAGYVSDDNRARIGEGEYAQLRGRFRFNNAVEVVSPDEADEVRFLNAKDSCVVALKPVGSPRPETGDVYWVYGENGLQPSGRVLYGHDEKVLKDSRSQSRRDPFTFEIGKGSVFFKSQQAALARFVVHPGRQFKVRLVFEALEEWELGALLCALRPEMLAEPTNQVGASAFGIKLGYGRALGLGSISCAIDDVCVWQDDEPSLDGSSSMFLRRQKDDSLVIRCIAGLQQKWKAAFPSKNPGRPDHISRLWKISRLT